MLLAGEEMEESLQIGRLWHHYLELRRLVTEWFLTAYSLQIVSRPIITLDD